MHIYKTTNLLNKNIYIGKEKENNNSYFGSGLLIKRALKKYGSNNFSKEIIEKCPINKVNDREKFWIQYYNSFKPKGYNIALGGDGGDTMSNHPDKELIYKKINHIGEKEVSCTECGEKFKVLKGSRYPICPPCLDKLNTHKCLNCSKEFKTNHGKRKIRNKLRKFCSNKCQQEFQRKNGLKRIFSIEHRKNLSLAMSKIKSRKHL